MSREISTAHYGKKKPLISKENDRKKNLSKKVAIKSCYYISNGNQYYNDTIL